MRLSVIVLFTLWVCAIFSPQTARCEATASPVRCLKVIEADSGGQGLKYPSTIFYDAAEDETYITTPGDDQLVLLASDYFPILGLGKGRGIKRVYSCHLSKGRLYTCLGPSDDDPRGRLLIYNEAWLPIGKIYFSGFEGADSFVPRKLAIGATGNLYVVGANDGKVVVLDPAGNYLRGLSMTEEVEGVPTEAHIASLTVGNDGRLYFLSETMGRVYVLDRKEKPLYRFGKKGGLEGELSRPRGIAIDDLRQRIYLVDYMRHTVSAYSTEGDFLFEFGGLGRNRGWFLYPSDACVDGMGRVLVTDTFNHRVQVFEVLEDRVAASP